METMHTKTPWKIEKTSSYDLLSGKTRIAFHLDVGDGKKVFCPDNETAEFIFQCVNSYQSDQEKIQSLLEAVKCASNLPHLDLYGYTVTEVHNLNHAVMSVIKTCEKALEDK